MLFIGKNQKEDQYWSPMQHAMATPEKKSQETSARKIWRRRHKK